MLKKKGFWYFAGFVLLVAFVYLGIKFIEIQAIKSFKDLYSAYNKTLQMTVNQMDGDTGCYLSSDKNHSADYSGCEKFYKNFADNLKITKYCKNNSLKNGCLPLYKTYTDSEICSGFSEKMMNRYNQTFVMTNGTTMTIFNQPENSPKPLFVVDANGKMFPNKSGYDLFTFVIMRNAGGNYYFHSNITYCLPMEKGGISKLQDIYK